MSNNTFTDQTKLYIEAIRNKYKGKRIGFTCSCFDLLHTGHLIMLKDCRDQCDVLIIGLQTDPTIDRPNKNKPIQSYFERKTMIDSIKYIDGIIEYTTEDDLYNILKTLNPDVRIIGSDWKGKKYTGHDIKTIPIHWHERKHNYSSTNLRRRVFEAEKAKEQ